MLSYIDLPILRHGLFSSVRMAYMEYGLKDYYVVKLSSLFVVELALLNEVSILTAEWIRRKWKVLGEFIKIYLVADVKTK